MVNQAAGADPTAQLDVEVVESGRLQHFTGRVKKLSRAKAVAALLALLVAVTVGLAAGLVYFEYRPDRAIDGEVAKSALNAASDGTVAVLSYAPDTLDRDFSSAKSRLTGSFLSYYSQFTEQIVAPAVKQKSVKVSAVVVRAAVAELHPDSAVVLVYVNQSTASKDRPEPTLSASSVLVTLNRVDAAWLISSFDPV